MIINKAYKVELRPNNRQRTRLAQSAGCARFAYNWGLAQRIELYKNGKQSTNKYEQHRFLCKIKKTEYPWMYAVTKCAPQEALVNLDNAFKRFFQNIKQGKKPGKKPGFPRFKSKHRSKNSFKITTGSIYVTKNSIKLPKISGPIRLKEKGYISTEDVKYNFFVVSEEAGRWFLSVNCEIQMSKPQDLPPEAEVIGIDVGIKELATVSDGRVYHNPKSYSKLERILSRTQRERCRRKKGSSNRLKTIRRLQKIHFRIRNVRKDSLHKLTSDLVRTKPSLIVLEDLAVRNMLKSHCLAKSLSDASFGEIRRQIEYKARWSGSETLMADRFFPSSKTCSSCGQIKDDLKLSDRVYKCECGLELDRDLNAALNLKRYGEFHRSLSKQKACGEERLQSVATLVATGGALRGSRNSTSDLSHVGRFV